MELSIPSSTTNSPLIPVFGDNVQDLLGSYALHVNPSAIITVNSTDDALNDLNSGVTTLRDAINQANSDTGEDLIVFDRSLFSNAQTITLNLGELDITHNLDIIAPRDSLTGADLVTVSGNKASRVFETELGSTVNISGLVIADGSVTGDNGGGILNSGTLTLDSSIVRNNSATKISSQLPGSQGGAIYSIGNLTVSNSIISGNSASFGGGGIYNSSGTSTILDTTISGNSAGANNFGGGIYNSSGISTIQDSTISGNSADTGGGIYNRDSTSTVLDTTISGNSTNYSGAGIYNEGGISTVQDSTISGNSSQAGGGGGIYNSHGTSTVLSSTINDNSARFGGGIYTQSDAGNIGITTVQNSTISGNSAIGVGGGIYNDYGSRLTLLFSTVTQNRSVNSGGAGVYKNEVSSFNSPLGSVSARNTIIASNLKNENGVNPDIGGTFTSNGYNLIGDSTGSTGFNQATGDIVGTSDNPIDPRLAPLDFNGGPTQTFALLPDSPAIGAGDPTVLDTDPTTDQRGLPRRAADGTADIGAFEFSRQLAA